MTYNPYDPTKPGQFNDWALHASKYGDLGVGRGTTHESFISKPSGGGWGWGSSGSPTSSSAPSYSSPAVSGGVPARITGGGGCSSYRGGGGSGSYSSRGGSGSAFWWVAGIIGLVVLGSANRSQHGANSSAASSKAATSSQLPAAWYDGQTDRNTWERWFAGLSEDYGDGAAYWADVRSTHPSAGVCASGRGWASASFRQGCLDARSFLMQVDRRHDTEPDYWYGWNYLTPPGKG